MPANPRTGKLDRQLGKRVRAERLARSMTQPLAAAAIGVTNQQFQKYESGADRMTAANLIQIAELFGIGLDELAGINASGAVNGIKFAEINCLWRRCPSELHEPILVLLRAVCTRNVPRA